MRTALAAALVAFALASSEHHPATEHHHEAAPPAEHHHEASSMEHHTKEKDAEHEHHTKDKEHEHHTKDKEAAPPSAALFHASPPPPLLLNTTSSMRAEASNTTGADPDAAEDFVQAFIGCFMVILATEIGDKTFFIAAILTMRHPRHVVWSGAVGALALMTVLSAVVGHAAPLLLPPALTHYAAVLLFLFFGGRMLLDSRTASSEVSDELDEVELELAAPTAPGPEDQPLATADDAAQAKGVTEDGAGGEAASEAVAHEQPDASAVGSEGSAAGVASGVLLQAFTLTFVAEWGDRSQIATIAMAADQDLLGVTLGGIVGHGLCTGIAVIGGKLLASRISERTVLLVGGTLFLLFSAAELLHGPAD